MDFASYKAHYLEHKYVVVQNVLPKILCEHLSRCALLKAHARPNVRRGSDTLADIHRGYGDPSMEVLFETVTPMVEAILGKALWPTLSFYYTYFHGNKLVAHKDRASCEINATICLGYDDRESDAWPIYIENPTDPKKPIPVFLKPGEMLVFHGSRREHWREPFLGQWHAQTLLSFVDQNGPLAHLKYDQRKSLGKKHIGMFNWSIRHAYHQFFRK